jgi:hypothetical protein
LGTTRRAPERWSWAKRLTGVWPWHCGSRLWLSAPLIAGLTRTTKSFWFRSSEPWDVGKHAQGQMHTMYLCTCGYMYFVLGFVKQCRSTEDRRPMLSCRKRPRKQRLTDSEFVPDTGLGGCMTLGPPDVIPLAVIGRATCRRDFLLITFPLGHPGSCRDSSMQNWNWADQIRKA